MNPNPAAAAPYATASATVDGMTVDVTITAPVPAGRDVYGHARNLVTLAAVAAEAALTEAALPVPEGLAS